MACTQALGGDESRSDVVHLCPVAGTVRTPCCDVEVLALPCNDRITEDPADVTCAAE